MAVGLLMLMGGFGAGYAGGLYGSITVLGLRGLWEPWRAARVELIQKIVDPLEIILFVITAIAFLVWEAGPLKRLRAEARSAPIPSTSVVWWFVPFASLVVPYRQVRALYRTFAPQVGGWVPTVWWFAFLVMSVSRRIAGKSNDLLPSLVAITATLLAAPLAVKVVLDIQRGIEASPVGTPGAPSASKGAAWLEAILGAPVPGVLAATLIFASVTALAVGLFPPEVDPGPHLRTGTLKFVGDGVEVSGLHWTFTRNPQVGALAEYELRVEARARLLEDVPARVRGIPILVEYDLMDEHGAKLDSLTDGFTLTPDKSELALRQGARFPAQRARLIRDIHVNVTLDESQVRNCQLGFSPCPPGFVCETWGGCSLDERDDDVAALEIRGRRTCAEAGRIVGGECLAAMHAHFQQDWGPPSQRFSIILCSVVGQTWADSCQTKRKASASPCTEGAVNETLTLTRACDRLFEPRISHALDRMGLLRAQERAAACRAGVDELPRINALVCNRPERRAPPSAGNTAR